MWNPEGKLAEYIQFRKDACNQGYFGYTDWTYDQFVGSGYVRAKLTSSKTCYVKRFNGILDVFKKPDILFYFNN